MRKIILTTIYVLFTSMLVYSQNIETLKEKAKNGNTQAQYQLANAYFDAFFDNKKEDKNFIEKATYWAKKAAYKNHSGAQALVAEIYIRNIFSSINEDEACKWAKKSSDAGNSDGTIWYAMLLINGEGCEENETKGKNLLIELANQNNFNAIGTLIALLKEPAYKSRDFKEYKYYLDKAVKNFKNFGYAQIDLALLYLEPEYRNEQKVFYWVKKAAESNEPVAQYALGSIYLAGTLESVGDEYFDDNKHWTIPIDVDKAKYWIKKAAKQGNEDAIYDIEEYEKNGWKYY